ncbi:MAG: FkbM family methyltransferase [Saprospiraceae bacterium]
MIVINTEVNYDKPIIFDKEVTIYPEAYISTTGKGKIIFTKKVNILGESQVFDENVNVEFGAYTISSLNPPWFGAKGYDDIDDTRSFKKAIEIARTYASTINIEIPIGNFIITKTLEIGNKGPNGKSININGSGMGVNSGLGSVHIGYYSLLLSTYVDRIYAFEPNPILVNRVRDIVNGSSVKDIEIFNIGVSKMNAHIPFHYDPSKHNLGSFKDQAKNHIQTVVEVKTLSDIIKDNSLKIPDIVKIDTKGSELDILVGYSMLQNDLPILFIEWMPEPGKERLMTERLFTVLGDEYEKYHIAIHSVLTPFGAQDELSSNLLLIPKISHKLKLIEKWIS